MRSAWRIVKPYRVEEAFSGEGARLYGGRWNSVGTAMVYTAESKALAALEILVHVDIGELMDDFLCIPIYFEVGMMRAIDPQSLLPDWRDPLFSPSCRAMGEAWFAEQASVVLKVPSVIVPGESNYLINPRHPDFGKMTVGPPEPFEFDARLLK